MSTAPPRSTDASRVGAGVRGDRIAIDDAGMGVGPSLDLVELLHADRHAAERQRHVGRRGCGLGLLSVEVGERIQVAPFDRVTARRQLLGRGFARRHGRRRRGSTHHPATVHHSCRHGTCRWRPTSPRAPTVGVMSLPIRPGMTIPLPGPLHAQRERIVELADLGLHRRVDGRIRWRGRAHAAGAGLGVGATPSARHGDPAGLHPSAGLHGTECGDARRRSPRTIRARDRLVLERDRRALERCSVRAAVPEGARPRAVPA